MAACFGASTVLNYFVLVVCDVDAGKALPVNKNIFHKYFFKDVCVNAKMSSIKRQHALVLLFFVLFLFNQAAFSGGRNNQSRHLGLVFGVFSQTSG